MTVGYDRKAVRKQLVKVGAKPLVLEIFDKTLTDEYFNASAFVHFQEETGCTVLWFPRWESNWDFINTLVHETNHMIYGVLCGIKLMGEEPEALAYQQEYLFDQIRRQMEKRSNGTSKL